MLNSLFSTEASRNADLLAEVGKLHMEVQQLEHELHHLRSLRDWVETQEFIFSPSICCRGEELEYRIHERKALAEMEQKRATDY